MVAANDLKVYKTTNFLGGAITGTQVPSANPNNIFTNVPKNELVIGEDYYASVYLKNTHTTEKMDNLKWWLSSKSFPQDTELKWGFDSSSSVSAPFLSFDGTNDYVDCTNDATLWSQSLTKFSFSFWVFNTGDQTDWRDIVNHGIPSNQGFNCFQDKTTANRIFFTIKDSGGVNKDAYSDNFTNNAWHFVTCVYDNSLGSANIKIYLNGVLGSQTANFTSAINLSSILTLGGSSTDVKGYIKDFRWWTTKALTQAEIDSIYAGTGDNITPNYWLKMTEGTGNPVDFISGTKVGTLSGTVWSSAFTAQTIADKYTSPTGISWNTVGSKPSTPNIGEFAVSETIPIWLWLHVPANAEARLDDTAAFIYEFDIPLGGTGTPGGGGGGGSSTTGYHFEPYAVMPAGAVTVTHTGALSLSTFTLACWFRTTKDYTADLAGYLITKGNYLTETAGNNINYALLISTDVDPDNVLEVLYENSSGQNMYNVSGVRVNDGQWHFGVGTFNGTQTKVYVDGVLRNTETASDYISPITPDTGTHDLIIGGHESFMTYQGDQDEVRIWNVALTDAEISNLYTNGVVPQQSAIVYENLFGGSGSDPGGSGGNPPPTPSDYKVAISGDWGCENETDDVIALIQSEGYNHVCGVGDNAYASASCWTTRFTPLKSIMNSAYGNHEYSESGGVTPYKTFFGHSLTYLTYKFQNIQFFIIDTNINCDVGSAQHNFIKAALEASQTDNTVTWRIAVFHHPMYGAPSEHAYDEAETRANFHSLFVTNKVNFVCTGHNHNFQRTHQLGYNSSSPSSPIVVDSSSPYLRSAAGFIHVISGAGGHDSGSSLYSLGTQPSYQAYQNRTNNGVWELVASNSGNTLTCSFVNTSGDKFDTFTITA